MQPLLSKHTTPGSRLVGADSTHAGSSLTGAGLTAHQEVLRSSLTQYFIIIALQSNSADGFAEVHQVYC